MSAKTPINIYVGSLITSVVGAILLIFEDFAGWYNYGYYVESWGYVGLYAETPLTAFVIILVAASLFYCSFISLQGLRTPSKVSKQKVKLGLILSIFALVIVLLGATAFIVTILEDEPSDWWFDAGFYGGFLGSALTATLFFFQYKSMEATLPELSPPSRLTPQE